MNDSEEKWRKTSTSAFIFVAKANLGCAHAEENQKTVLLSQKTEKQVVEKKIAESFVFVLVECVRWSFQVIEMYSNTQV